MRPSSRGLGSLPTMPVMCCAGLVVCGLLGLAAESAGAQEPAKKKARPQVKLVEAPLPTAERVYKRTPQGDLKLHLYFPPGGESRNVPGRPAIVFFFGGGWKNGSFQQFVPQAEYLASRGLVAACADYRILSEHQTTPDKCVEDAKSAVRWLRSHAQELGIDPQKVIAAGGSAGGHLAAATALVPGFDCPDDDRRISCVPNALVLFNPALDLSQSDVKNGAGEPIGKAISPTLFLQAGAPPTVIFFGTADRLTVQGEEFLRASRKLGNRVELYTAADMPHGFFNRSPWLEVTARQADEFLGSLGYVVGPPTLKLPAQAPQLVRQEVAAGP